MTKHKRSAASQLHSCAWLYAAMCAATAPATSSFCMRWHRRLPKDEALNPKPCRHSRGMAGCLAPGTLAAAKDENGTSFREAAAQAGYPSSSEQVHGPDRKQNLTAQELLQPETSTCRLEYEYQP